MGIMYSSSMSPLSRFMNSLGDRKVLNREQTKAYFERIKAGDDIARLEFTDANIRFVIYVAKKYANGDETLLLDLIQEGTIGLMEAIDRFEVEEGNKFSTYAVWWIRQKITRALADKYSRLARVPVHQEERARKVWKAECEFIYKFDRMPTDEELVKACGLSLKAIRHIKLFRVAEKSLDAEILDNSGDSSGMTYHDKVSDITTPLPSTLVEARDELRYLCSNLQLMMERSSKHPRLMSKWNKIRKIIMYRSGLDGHDDMRTLDQAGKKFKVTRERIRQIEALVVRKLDQMGFEIGGPSGWNRMVERIHELRQIVPPEDP